jgi:hypothetical protein
MVGASGAGACGLLRSGLTECCIGGVVPGPTSTRFMLRFEVLCVVKLPNLAVLVNF